MLKEIGPLKRWAKKERIALYIFIGLEVAIRVNHVVSVMGPGGNESTKQVIALLSGHVPLTCFVKSFVSTSCLPIHYLFASAKWAF